MFSAVSASSKVVSIRDVDYELPINDTFHPSCLKGAIKRLSARYASVRHILPIVMKNSAAKGVWGIVFERKNNPHLVISNLKYARTRPYYRRILRVVMDELTPPVSPMKFTIVNDKYEPESKSEESSAEKMKEEDLVGEDSTLENMRQLVTTIAILLVAIVVVNITSAISLHVLTSKHVAT